MKSCDRLAADSLCDYGIAFGRDILTFFYLYKIVLNNLQALLFPNKCILVKVVANTLAFLFLLSSQRLICSDFVERLKCRLSRHINA